jgi:hypothetical protein
MPISVIPLTPRRMDTHFDKLGAERELDAILEPRAALRHRRAFIQGLDAVLGDAMGNGFRKRRGKAIKRENILGRCSQV